MINAIQNLFLFGLYVATASTTFLLLAYWISPSEANPPEHPGLEDWDDDTCLPG